MQLLSPLIFHLFHAAATSFSSPTNDHEIILPNYGLLRTHCAVLLYFIGYVHLHHRTEGGREGERADVKRSTVSLPLKKLSLAVGEQNGEFIKLFSLSLDDLRRYFLSVIQPRSLRVGYFSQ